MRIGLLLLLFLHTLYLLAQDDSTWTVPVVAVTAMRGEAFGAGLRRYELDSTARVRLAGQSVGRWLGAETPVFVRQSGPGGLVSLGTRGTAGYHTAVLWEGIAIQSRVFGQTDLNLIPIGLHQTVGLQLGGAGALYGSGFVGGAVVLAHQTPTAGTSLLLQQRLGGFGEVGNAVIFSHQKNGWWAHLAGTYLYARNDFPFTTQVLGGETTTRRQHNAFGTWGLMPSVGYRHGKHSLALHGWWQEASRELPGPPSSQTSGTARQDDNALRLLLHYKYTGDRWQWNLRLAHLRERLWYWFNPELSETVSYASFRTWLGELEARYRIHPTLVLLLGAQLTPTNAQNSNYPTSYQPREAAFGALRYERKRLSADLSIRQERADEHLQPLTPAFSARWQPKQLSVHGSASRVYRLPTFNERFWPPGNPDLQPERGYATDLGLGWMPRPGTELDATAFLTELNGWVIWTTAPEGIRPRNVQRVRSRGLELTGAHTLTLGESSLKLSGGYTYTDASIRASSDPREVGRQNLYTPYHQAWGSLALQLQRAYVQYAHRYTGVRYGTTTGQEHLEPFATGSLMAGATLGKRPGWRLDVTLSNLWNAPYAVQPGYPMPGRSFQVSLTTILQPDP